MVPQLTALALALPAFILAKLALGFFRRSLEIDLFLLELSWRRLDEQEHVLALPSSVACLFPFPNQALEVHLFLFLLREVLALFRWVMRLQVMLLVI